jgi:quercetin dioxygenase-like cupin family protein
MKVFESGIRASRRGPAEHFTGTVWINDIAQQVPPGRVRALCVSFEPGARTAWHRHPFGQILHVLSGVGRVQLDGEAPHEIRPGDSVCIEAGELHWHGAAPDQAFVHIALQEDEPNKTTCWKKHVTDPEYAQPARRG